MTSRRIFTQQLLTVIVLLLLLQCICSLHIIASTTPTTKATTTTIATSNYNNKYNNNNNGVNDTVISKDTTWTTDQTVRGELIIEKDVTLQIEKGVHVWMQPGMSVIVNGVLRALGTINEPIMFNISSDSSRSSRSHEEEEGENFHLYRQQFLRRRVHESSKYSDNHNYNNNNFVGNNRWGRILFTSDAQPSVVVDDDHSNNVTYVSGSILRSVHIENSYQDFSIDIQYLPTPSRNRKFYMEDVHIHHSGGIRAIDAALYLKQMQLTASKQQTSYDSAVHVGTTISYFNGFSFVHIEDSVFDGYRSGVHVENCATGSVSKVLRSRFSNLESQSAIYSTCNMTIDYNQFYASRISMVMPAGTIDIVRNLFMDCVSGTIDLLQALPQRFVIESNTFSHCVLNSTTSSSSSSSADSLIQKPSWRNVHQMIIKKNTFDTIASPRPLAHLLLIESDATELSMTENVFYNVLFHQEGGSSSSGSDDDEDDDGDDNNDGDDVFESMTPGSASLFVFDNARSVKLWDNEFRDKLGTLIRVESSFEQNAVIDARYNRWTEVLSAEQVRSKVIDFVHDDTKSYVSLFPAFVGPNHTKIIYSSSNNETVVKSANIIGRDVTWNRLNSKINHTKLIIEYGATVTVEPGTTVHVPKSGYIVVLGELYAKGQPENQIVFTTDNFTETWNTLVLAVTTTSSDRYPSVIEHVTLDRANGMVPTIEVATDTKIEAHHVTINKDNSMQSEGGYCVLGYSDHVNLDLSHFTLRHCNRGVKADSKPNSKLKMTHSIFEQNQVGVDCSKAECFVSDNQFDKNYIGVQGSNLVLANNQFKENSWIALRSTGHSTLTNNKFEKNAVDIELSGFGYNHVWHKNRFASPSEHFFQTFQYQIPRVMNMTENEFINGKCSLRSPIAIDFSSNFMHFADNTVENCDCELGDVVRLSGLEKTSIVYNTFKGNKARVSPSSREKPSIFTTEQPDAEFKYNGFSPDNDASVLFFRQSSSSTPLSVSLNYWGYANYSSIREKIDGESSEMEIVLTPFFITEDTHNLDANNLRCQDGYRVDGLACVEMKPPGPSPPPPKPEPSERKNPEWSAPMILLVSILWLSGGVLVIGFFVVLALCIKSLRRRREIRRAERYHKQEDTELPSVVSPTVP